MTVDQFSLIRVEDLFSVYMMTKVSTSRFEGIATAIAEVWEGVSNAYTGVNVKVMMQDKYVTSERYLMYRYN